MWPCDERKPHRTEDWATVRGKITIQNQSSIALVSIPEVSLHWFPSLNLVSPGFELLSLLTPALRLWQCPEEREVGTTKASVLVLTLHLESLDQYSVSPASGFFGSRKQMMQQYQMKDKTLNHIMLSSSSYNLASSVIHWWSLKLRYVSQHITRGNSGHQLVLKSVKYLNSKSRPSASSWLPSPCPVLF